VSKKNENTVSDVDVSVAAPKKGKRLWIVLGIVVAILVVGGAGGFVWHEQPSFCSTLCHSTMAPYYESYSGSTDLVAKHAEKGITCLDCHTPTMEQQIEELQIQISGEAPDPLKEREFDTAFCGGEDCHGAATLADMAELTSDIEPNPHDNHAVLGAKCTLCHNMHRPQATMCTDCHTEGWGYPF